LNAMDLCIVGGLARLSVKNCLMLKQFQ